MICISKNRAAIVFVNLLSGENFHTEIQTVALENTAENLSLSVNEVTDDSRRGKDYLLLPRD